MRHAFQGNQLCLHASGCKLLHRSLGKSVILGRVQAAASEQNDWLVIPTETRPRGSPTRTHEAIQIDAVRNDLGPLPKHARQALEHRRILDDNRGCREPRQAAHHGAYPRTRSARYAAFLAINVAAAVAHQQRRPGAGANIGDDRSRIAKVCVHKVKGAAAQRLVRAAS